ncbi:MAG TPA: DNA mismatch repair endonuclease MutL [Gemmataceae bacterium]|nr:DNA mismatch repair endonuclease MutL [Gemmataceae bacterium]
MPRIHQLPTSVITKIAAGEVIERPASVVKELVENSVDAGSTRIDIAVEQGGVELIRVVDDGCGIARDDLTLAFACHATSKLNTADDLFRVQSLGFRGEALASISGVGQVTLQSRPADQDIGAELSCNGGELSEVRPWNGAAGTRIEVRHLFYNTPVRRKFLRTIATELGHVSEVVTKLALSHPHLHLTLLHNNKMVFEVPPTIDLPERIGLFFGGEVRKKVYELDIKQGPARLHGFIVDPACDRGNAKLQYLFLNGRWIRDRSLSHALQEAYRGLLMTGRYAIAFLFLDLPPDLVDVNVHPTKVEVRFRDAQPLYHLMLVGVRDRLRRESLTPKLHAPPFAPMPTLTPMQPVDRLPFPTVEIPRPQPAAALGALPSSSLPWSAPAPATVPAQNDTIASEDEEQESEAILEPMTSDLGVAPQAQPPQSGVWSLRPATKAIQLHNAYLVLETEEGMLVIDQHALHERILFDQLRTRIRGGTLERQRLLIPEPVELPADQAARLLEQRAALAELGLEVEAFGGSTLLVTCYPAMLGQQAPAEILRAVADHLAAHDRAPNREQLFNDLLSLMACHAAVKAGDPLTPELIEELLAQRELANDPHHCPHGRPTALLFSRQDLDRQFRRI